MSDITKNDLVQLEESLSQQIKDQGVELRKEIKDQGVELRKEIKDQGVQFQKNMEKQGKSLRQEIKDSTEEVLEVITQLANSTHSQLEEIRSELELIKLDVGMIKRGINDLNSDIDKAFKNKTITEDETTALIAGQKRLERWIEQIAKETGVKLAV